MTNRTKMFPGFTGHWLSRRTLLALFLLAIATGFSSAESDPSQYGQKVWRIEQGLPQNRIRALSQTPDGYLWIGTSEGLARFDGVRFTVFDRSNTDALEDDGIITLLLARDGALWIGTEGGGVVKYSGGVFRRYSHREGLTNGFVRCLFEDEHRILWVGTDRGLFQLGGERFIRRDQTPEIPFATVNGIAADVSGQIWFSSSVGLLRVVDGKLVKSRSACAAQNIRFIQSSGSHHLWAVHSTGLNRLVDGCPQSDRTLPEVPIRSVREDSEGSLWICTVGRGLMRIRDGRTTSLTVSDGLPENNVNVVFEDREKNLWVGTEDGLLRLTRSPVTSIGNAEGLDDSDVLTISKGLGNHFWIATLAGQVYCLTGERVVRHFLPSPFSHALVQTVLEDRDGVLWFGTFHQGLIRQDGEQVTVFDRSNGLRSNTVRQLLQDTAGNIWVALESGFSRWDGRSFRNYYLEDGLSYPSIRCMLLDSRGDLLIGTDSGLNRLHDGRIVRDAQFKLLAHEKIWSLYQDRDGTLWLGTRGGGLLRFNQGSLFRFNTSNGLPGNAVFQILEDHKRNLWMSTSTGIVSVARKDLTAAAVGSGRLARIVPYGTEDGMASIQMNGGFQPAGAINERGDLWFPSVKGAVRIKPLNQPSQSPSPILVEKIIADDKAIQVSPLVSIPAGRGKIEIDFTRCDLADPLRLSFRYKLEGFDERWTVSSRTRSANYTNLPPGDYRFRIMANSTASFTSSPSELAIRITKKPLFYQTGWFFALMVTVVAGLIWCGFGLYARQTRLRYSLLLNERARLAREIHDTVIQGCVSVSALLEAADGYKHVNAGTASTLIDDARHQVVATLEEARQAVWDLRHGSPAESSIEILFELARKLGESSGIRIETEVVGKGSANSNTDRTLLLVGREALRNAAAHSRAGRISVRVVFTAAEINLEVDDDGIGFHVQGNGNGVSRHFGLMGMEERAHEIGGTFSLATRPGAGTSIRATFPREI